MQSARCVPLTQSPNLPTAPAPPPSPPPPLLSPTVYVTAGRAPWRTHRELDSPWPLPRASGDTPRRRWLQTKLSGGPSRRGRGLRSEIVAASPLNQWLGARRNPSPLPLPPSSPQNHVGAGGRGHHQGTDAAHHLSRARVMGGVGSGDRKTGGDASRGAKVGARAPHASQPLPKLPPWAVRVGSCCRRAGAKGRATPSQRRRGPVRRADLRRMAPPCHRARWGC